MTAKKILMIDDDTCLLEVMRDLLEMEGYDFTGLTATDDIVLLARNTSPDLILLDYCLRGTDGGELCRKLKAESDMAHLPIVLLSAYPQQRLALDVVPVSVFIPKPFDLWEFLSCIQELLRLHTGWAGAA